MLGTDSMLPTKYVVISAITSLVVAMACIIGGRLFFTGNDHNSSTNRPEKTAREIHANIDAITKLQSDLRTLTAQLADISHSSGDVNSLKVSTDSSDIVGRVEAIENAVEELYTLSSAPHDNHIYDLYDQLSTRLQESVEGESHAQYTMAETVFDSDDGKPLGDFSTSISDVLHSVDGLVVIGFDCRDTVCKVTYAKPESPDSLEEFNGRSEFVDKLAQSAGDSGVDIRYADDPSGNSVMYIQLQ